MKRIYLLIIGSLLFLLGIAQTPSSDFFDSFPNNGTTSQSSSFFRDYYHYNDVAHYLDNFNTFITYQQETTGNFNMSDQMIFSIGGNSYKWNKFYIDGFRTDSRFLVGSSFYQPNLYTHSLDVNYHTSIISFTTDTDIPNSATISYNIGGIGGIAPGTKALIGLFHSTASERMYKPIEQRNKIRGASTVRLDYTIPVHGQKYVQQLYADFGERKIVNFNQNGISEYYPTNFYKVQLNGQLPIKANKFFDKTNYLLHISNRNDLYSELYYGMNETSIYNAYSASIYSSKHKTKSDYTMGFTWTTNKVKHNNLNFSRNAVDQDGEAMEPWYPDGITTELSYALNYDRKLTNWLHLHFDGYNSAIRFRPTTDRFQNTLYFQLPADTTSHSLYVYDWETQSFWSGLLENTFSLQAEKEFAEILDLKANINFTLDAMLLSGKSMARPNWEAHLGLKLHPCKWFAMELNLSKNRVTFNWDDIQYFSNDYLNGNIYYWQDANNDLVLQDGEKKDYFTSTGGKYHTAKEHLRQTSYFVFDIPVYFRFGRHEISFMQSYRKYYNTWFTRYDKDATEYGYYTNGSTTQNMFFLNGEETIHYIVDDAYPENIMGNKFLTNTPYYLSSVIKYQYTSPKFMLSLAWQSYLMGGLSSLGNGPLHNNIGVLSETTANPNTLNNSTNSESPYRAIGRLDQDRAYVAWIFAAYNINKHFSLALTGKFKDGQPFTSFDTQLNTLTGNNQLAIQPRRTKGINPIDNNFGSRKDAFFNIDLRATYRDVIYQHNFEFQLACYNVWDFGTELTEYTFNNNIGDNRYAMSLCIPRGLLLTVKMDLNPNK